METGIPGDATQRVMNVGDPVAPALPPIVLDRLNRVLLGPDGARVELPYLSLRLLEALAAVSPAFVRSDELLERVWPDTHISADVLKQRVRLLRVALAGAGYDARLLDSVRGEGYALRARLVDADAAIADGPAPSGTPVTVAPPAPAAGGASHRAAWRRFLPASLVLLALVAATMLWVRGGADARGRGAALATLGPSPVRLGIVAPVGSSAAARLLDLLGNTPNLLLVPLSLTGSPAGTDACPTTALLHLCLSVLPTAGGNTIAVTQRRTGALVLRETVDASSSIELAALRVAQLAAPGALRWLGGSPRGDVVFDQYRGAMRALEQCDSVVRSESLTGLRRIALQSPDFLPARALLAALAVEAAGATNDGAQVARMTAEAAAILSRTPDFPLAYLAIARGAALRGDTAAGRVAMSRAVRLLPVLTHFYDESAMPRTPTRCAGTAAN
jgi:DNA-binding winged helix-turn-helix (wHTH) protein